MDRSGLTAVAGIHSVRAALKFGPEGVGEAARARLRGQLAGLLGAPRMLSWWRTIQATRMIDDRTLSVRLTQIDGDPDRG